MEIVTPWPAAASFLRPPPSQIHSAVADLALSSPMFSLSPIAAFVLESSRRCHLYSSHLPRLRLLPPSLTRAATCTSTPAAVFMLNSAQNYRASHVVSCLGRGRDPSTAQDGSCRVWVGPIMSCFGSGTTHLDRSNSYQY